MRDNQKQGTNVLWQKRWPFLYPSVRTLNIKHGRLETWVSMYMASDAAKRNTDSGTDMNMNTPK